MWSETRFVGTSLASVRGERLEAGKPGARTASWSPSSAQAGRHPLSWSGPCLRSWRSAGDAHQEQNEKYSGSLSPVPGTEPLKPLEFPE